MSELPLTIKDAARALRSGKLTSVGLTTALIERANRLEWAIHNLERAADRTTNICEWVIYMAEGTYKELDSEFEAPPAITD